MGVQSRNSSMVGRLGGLTLITDSIREVVVHHHRHCTHQTLSGCAPHCVGDNLNCLSEI
jgi:hypothetical protein